MNRLSTCILLVLFSSTLTQAQVKEWKEGETYKQVKVKLASGATLRAARLTVNGAELSLQAGGTPRPVVVPLKDVKQVQMATGNQLAAGLGIGAIGSAVAFGIIKAIEKPKTETSYESGPGYSSTTTTTTTTYVDPGTKILVLSTPIILGALIGAKIPGKWKAIYSSDQANQQVSWNFAVSHARPGNPLFGFQLRF